MSKWEKLLQQILRAMIHYVITIFWSAADKAFVADVPELPGCMADGKTYEEALRNAQEAIDLWISTAKEFGDKIPVPRERLAYA